MQIEKKEGRRKEEKKEKETRNKKDKLETRREKHNRKKKNINIKGRHMKEKKMQTTKVDAHKILNYLEPVPLCELRTPNSRFRTSVFQPKILAHASKQYFLKLNDFREDQHINQNLSELKLISP